MLLDAGLQLALFGHPVDLYLNLGHRHIFFGDIILALRLLEATFLHFEARAKWPRTIDGHTILLGSQEKCLWRWLNFEVVHILDHCLLFLLGIEVGFEIHLTSALLNGKLPILMVCELALAFGEGWQPRIRQEQIVIGLSTLWHPEGGNIGLVGKDIFESSSRLMADGRSKLVCRSLILGGDSVVLN